METIEDVRTECAVLTTFHERADQGVIQAAASPAKDPGALLDGVSIDIFTLRSAAAMKMLCSSVETLGRMTGDVPPVSLLSTPIPHMLLAEKGDNANENRDNERPRSRQSVKNPADINNVPPKECMGRPIDSATYLANGPLSHPLDSLSSEWAWPIRRHPVE